MRFTNPKQADNTKNKICDSLVLLQPWFPQQKRHQIISTMILCLTNPKTAPLQTNENSVLQKQQQKKAIVLSCFNTAFHQKQNILQAKTNEIHGRSVGLRQPILGFCMKIHEDLNFTHPKQPGNTKNKICDSLALFQPWFSQQKRHQIISTIILCLANPKTAQLQTNENYVLHKHQK